MDGERFTLGGKVVTVYPSPVPDRPAVYLNTFGDEGAQVSQALGRSDFTLVTICGLTWDRDMASWDSPPVSKGDAPFVGGADGYLRLLVDEIVPRAENLTPKPVLWRGLAGYSLAGLFALYALHRTGIFSRAASVSGSLWYPGFQEYALSHEMPRRPDRLYFSLGDRESRTGNPLLRTVQKRTEALWAYYAGRGIDTVLRLNPGNHFHDPAGRTAAGITWLLEQ